MKLSTGIQAALRVVAAFALLVGVCWVVSKAPGRARRTVPVAHLRGLRSTRNAVQRQSLVVLATRVATRTSLG